MATQGTEIGETTRDRPCPTCGEPAVSVTATREPVVKMLCEQPSDEARTPGAEWARYEPCGHEVDL